MNSLAKNRTTDPSGSFHTSDRARRRLVSRYRREKIFKMFGLAAILIATGFLFLLLFTIVKQGLPAITQHYLTIPVDFSQVNKEDPKSADYNLIVRQGLGELLPFANDRKKRKVRNGLVSSASNILVRDEVVDNPELVNASNSMQIPMSDFADLYVKGSITEKVTMETIGTASSVEVDGGVRFFSTSDDFSLIVADIKELKESEAESLRFQAERKHLSLQQIQSRLNSVIGEIQTTAGEVDPGLETTRQNLVSSLETVATEIQGYEQQALDIEQSVSTVDGELSLNERLPTYLVHVNGGVVRIQKVSASTIFGEPVIPLESTEDAEAGKWWLEKLTVPESNRKFSDTEIVWTDYLVDKGLVSNEWNTIFFTSGASREPEMAGIWGAVIGSFLTLLVTLALAFPTGVAAAIYLEELAPRNRLTDLIEVNINNLAAVPSIVFGLLGLALFLNVFGMPRSAPVVGGMVLALMTLPTIIIAARAALKAVPPSIREAALGVGASRRQAVFHHVLPLAMPGIFTGTIIGMAQALGETAPLLMIGMVAFIVDIPGGFFDPSTVLPVQIFMWADFPEPAFQQKTSAAIMVLLMFLISMNAIAILLRKRFERRW